MKKIYTSCLIMCLFIGGAFFDPLKIDAQSTSTLAFETQDMPIYALCYAGRTYVVYYGTVSTRGKIVKQGQVYEKPGYDAWFKTFTSEILVYRYRDSYGNFYEPLKDHSYNHDTLWSQNINIPCEDKNIFVND